MGDKVEEYMEANGLTLDDLPFDYGDTPERVRTAAPRKCRHAKEYRVATGDGGWTCTCGHVASAEAVRRGRNNRKRGNRKQRDVLLGHGFANVGGAGGAEDGLDDRFAVQHKAYATGRYPGWALQELDHLRADASDNLATVAQGRVPLLIVSESPGSGRKAREPLAVLTLHELLALVRDE